MKVFIFTESFVNKDGDLDMHDIKAFTDENKAKGYYERSCTSLEVAGYGKCWHEEEYECDPYLMQTYFENESRGCKKLLILAQEED